MSNKQVKIKVMRHNPDSGEEFYFQEYTIPLVKGMSVMCGLDYIYQNLDSTLAYYDHAGCSLGICGRCTVKINGKAGLLCQTELEGDVVIEPAVKERTLKDLVVLRSTK